MSNHIKGKKTHGTIAYIFIGASATWKRPTSETMNLSCRCFFLLLLLVSHLRLRQQRDVSVEGDLTIFCHNTLPAAA